ncbi:zinc-binding dehydrogenase [Pseudohalocynthiibacter aestuariivivens]|uniref:Zinc-binding dehydrogenase n=1 Tax=Pseudohalocynthiibacter aestuariivivens TaxID=1591409 RepID=A0ABV5JGM7_9RHOB|nr:zinc-binding dehydrogenase [Pseudohalocynthiibacter aestuariivivens]MBS9719026.1 zinc-binding dehydrogenase [Pseudohalocynthiibacter aestuariivivens]
MVPEVMSGVYLTRHGGPDALEWCDDIPVPSPGAGQVLVRVLAAGVNNTDINTRVGWYSSDVSGATEDVGEGADIEDGGWGGAVGFPRIQGGDICGTVVAVGDGVTSVELGARVTSQINIPRPTPDNRFAYVALGSELDGAFAQYCLLQEGEIFDVSASPLSNEEIAAIPCGFGTAYNLLTRSDVGEGQKVLITGASGVVGLAAVQLAVLRGAQVTGVAADEKAAAVRQAGAIEVLPRSVTPPAQEFDAVIDVVAGKVWPDLIRALKPGGHYAVSGAIAGPMVEADLREIYLTDITIHGCSFMSREVFSGLVKLMIEGRVKPAIAKIYPLRDIAQAQVDFQSKKNAGKLILLP